MSQGHIEHEDYLAAPHALRFRGDTLKLLFTLLTTQSEGRPAMVWSTRILPDGALVAMTRTTDGSRILRIARKSAFRTTRGPDLWNAEIHTFLSKFGCMLWTREDEDDATGVAVRFHETSPLPRCPQCSGLMDPVALAAMGNICGTCAFKAKMTRTVQEDAFAGIPREINQGE